MTKKHTIDTQYKIVILRTNKYGQSTKAKAVAKFLHKHPELANDVISEMKQAIRDAG